MNKILAAVIAIVLFIAIAVGISVTAASEAYIPSESTILSKEHYKTQMDLAHQMAESARALGYAEDSNIISQAKEEWNKAFLLYSKAVEQEDKLAQESALALQLQQEQAKWNERMEEYPVATTIWKYLKDLGYNDYVCAGIMGNIMVEVGGQTLNIRHDAYDASGYYYGICQWNRGSYKSVHGTNLNTQLEFLKNTIKYEFDTFGKAYGGSDFKYQNFLDLTNEQDAAYAFAKCYERCAAEYYGIRKTCATKALEYFTS